jgi:hypothetical protein
MLRIGVLLPRSSLFPAFGLDILTGIKSCLKHFGITDNFKLLTDNIGFGIEEAEIYTKAERLLLQEDADIVMVVADNAIGELLEPLFTTSNKLLLLVNTGAGIPDNWQSSPTTIVHTLNLSLHARLTGKLAAQENENKKGVYVLSYYDAGYRQVFSMMTSHQQYGGEPMFTHVTHLKAEQFTLAPLEEFLEQDSEVKTVLCLFTGEMAEQFCNEILPVQDKFRLRLYASPMLLEVFQTKLAAQQLPATMMKGYTCWTPGLDNTGNSAYKTAFKTAANKEATIFGALGWDTGLLLKAVLQQHQQGNTNAAAIVPALCHTVYESPRGWMKIDPQTFYTYAPPVLIGQAEDGKTITINEFQDTDTEWKQFTAEKFPPGTSSGWRNTYLCI